MESKLTLRVGPTASGAVGLTPLINGRDLVDLITEFEVEHEWSPAGGYGGLIPAHFRFGDLALYFLGMDNDQWPRPGQAWLLGCDCGEPGCWPLEASVASDSATVTWSVFAQPFRRERDYLEFGPFTFDRAQYEAEVAAAIQALQSATH